MTNSAALLPASFPPGEADSLNLIEAMGSGLPGLERLRIMVERDMRPASGEPWISS